MKLWLVRHARPLTAPGTCYGRTDVAADAVSTLDQARRLAAVLPDGVPVFSSPLRRCAALAEALGAERTDLHWRADARLQELNFGTWEGRRWSDIAPSEFSEWLGDFAHHRVGAGESVQQLMDRVAGAAADTRDCAGSPSPVVRSEAVWITHAGVIRAACLLASGVAELRNARQWPLHAPACGHWTRVLWPAGCIGTPRSA